MIPKQEKTVINLELQKLLKKHCSSLNTLSSMYSFDNMHIHGTNSFLHPGVNSTSSYNILLRVAKV